MTSLRNAWLPLEFADGSLIAGDLDKLGVFGWYQQGRDVHH